MFILTLTEKEKKNIPLILLQVPSKDIKTKPYFILMSVEKIAYLEHYISFSNTFSFHFPKL